MRRFKAIIIFISYFLSFNLVLAQKKNMSSLIKGKIVFLDKDSIKFSNGFIKKGYYEFPEISAFVKNNIFNLPKYPYSYPHLYFLSVSSEKNDIAFRKGDFFIDVDTYSIIINLDKDTENIHGKTYLEYKTKFLPFFIKDVNKISTSSIDEFIFTDIDFDHKLLRYVQQNPNSYVALWALIRGAYVKGHTSIYKEILNAFNSKIKNESLWLKFGKDFNNIRIKDNAEFPNLLLKNNQLENEKIIVTSSKYVLIDYWFSRCRPCLESFPKLKEIYEKYNHLGFEIIGISVDKQKDIVNWNKRINEYSLPWKQYIDVDGYEATKDNINSFPYNFILEDGKVIKRKISLSDLDKFLQNNLINNNQNQINQKGNPKSL